MGVGATHFASPLLLPVSRWLLLYNLSYKISVYLVFGWLSRLIVLYFSCKFNAVIGGGEHSIHLLHHLHQNSLSLIPNLTTKGKRKYPQASRWSWPAHPQASPKDQLKCKPTLKPCVASQHCWGTKYLKRSLHRYTH